MSAWSDCTLGDVVVLQRGHDLTAVQRKAGSVPIIGSSGLHGFHDTALAPAPGVTVGRSSIVLTATSCEVVESRQIVSTIAEGG